MDDGEALDERTARRIIALLVSFATLAERAAGRSYPVRWFVLSLLRYAEKVVLAHVAEATQADWSFDVDLESGSRPMDAMLLAWRLRLLAESLGALLAPPRHPNDWTLDLDGWTFGRDAAQARLAPCANGLFVIPNGGKPALHDTS